MIQLSDESAIRLLNRLAPLRLLAAATLLGLLLAACGADVDTTDSPPPQSNAAATASAAGRSTPTISARLGPPRRVMALAALLVAAACDRPRSRTTA